MQKAIIISIAIALTSLSLPAYSQVNPFQTRPGQAVAPNSPEPGSITYECVQGMITVKLKEGVGEFGKQSGPVRFGVSTLDEKASRFEVFELDKRFRYNPSKLRADLPDLSRIYRISFPDKYTLEEVVETFGSDPNVEYAEPIPVLHAGEVTNDSLYSQLQHLPQIHAPEAWEVHKGQNGTQTVIIAINDTGVDWRHADLRSNIWQNLGEDADGDGHTMQFNGLQWVLDPGDLNGVDDDGNGFTDDLLGWNFITNNGDPSPIAGNPMGSHGTHCAGISNGVTGNGKGIASVSYNLTVMPICTDQNNSLPYAWDGMIYAAENGADIISNSWYWMGGDFNAYQEIVNYASGLGSVIVAAACNFNTSALGYPASFQNVISVASVSFDDKKAAYSTYNFAVDVSAPGGGSDGGILSTVPGNEYALMSGTSMATPMAAGCLGLLKSYHPEWTNDQLITQLLGTADPIDSLNPNYLNMLGSGRINVYRMLTEENVMPFLKLDLISFDDTDANGNDINEPGEIVTLNLNLHNYAPSLVPQNVDVSISTNDPDVIIINGTTTASVPPDSSFSILDQFQIQVGANAISHFAELTLHFESDLQIMAGQDIPLKVLVNPSGIFVYEGQENGQDYSGTFITSFLDHLGYYYTYSNSYPGLMGFETVFLSYANSGQQQDMGTPFTEEQSLQVQEFLEGGGNLYIEMGGMFYKMHNEMFSNLSIMKQLFGVSSYNLSNSENMIDTLQGVANTPAAGILFTGSDQLYNWHIDKLTPVAGAQIPFTEKGFGNVAIMKDGTNSYGHKAFYFGYSLAELDDRDAMSSRYNVLLKTMEFFGYELPQGYILSNFIVDKSIGGVGMQVQFSDISISGPSYPITSWQWDFDNDGNIDSYDQSPVWTYNSVGTYSVKLITSNALKSDTLLKEGLITINSGILVYESLAGGYDLSGSYIRDQLQEKGYPVTYQSNFPESLEGFSAAFLSFGNDITGGTWLEAPLAKIITNYLEGGGYVYLEGAIIFSWFQKDNLLFFDLFGMDSADYHYEANPIDSLGGQPDALTDELLFTGNSQISNRYLDIYHPAPDAVASFVESNFGIVGVQHSVPESHRTFCFSYVLAELTDGESPNTREELLERILNFFDIYTAVPNIVGPSNTMSCKVFPNPVRTGATIQYYLPEESQVVLEIFNSMGQRILQPANGKQMEGGHQVLWNAEGMPAGVYFYTLTAGKQAHSGKIVVLE